MNLTTSMQCDEQVDQARRHMQAGRPHLAIRVLWRTLRGQPGHVPARLLLAEAMIRTDQFEEALHHLDTADSYLRTDEVAPARQMVRHHLLRGRVLQRLGRTTEAIDCWRQATAADPRCVAALRALAAALHEDGQHEQALRAADRLLTLKPADEPTMRLIIAACEALGDFDRAIAVTRHLARCRAARSGITDALRFKRSECLQLARLMRQAGRLADATALYHRLADAVTGDAELACEWADLAAELGDEPRVARLLGAAIDNDGRHERALTMLAEHKMRTGRFIEAGRLWWRLHQFDPERIEPLAHLLVCAVQAMRHTLIDRIESRFAERRTPNERRAAVTAAWRCAVPGEVLTDLLEHRDMSGDASVLGGLLSEAVDTFENVLPEHREYADVHYHLAVCHDELQEPVGAADCLDRALRINPGYVAAACRRAEQLLDDGHAPAADAVIAAAADRHPHDPRITALQQRIADAQRARRIAEAA